MRRDVPCEDARSTHLVAPNVGRRIPRIQITLPLVILGVLEFMRAGGRTELHTVRRSPAPHRWMGSPEQGKLQSVAGARPGLLFVTSETSPHPSQTEKMSSETRLPVAHDHIQHSSPYSIPPAGYPNIEHWLRHASAELLLVLIIWYGKVRSAPGSL